MGIFSSLINAGASIYGDRTAASSAQDTNNMNLQISQENNAFNASEAAKTRAFTADQARIARGYDTFMSDTSMERRVADLKRAHLNPALAYQLGGESSPMSPVGGGAQASSAGLPRMENPKASYANLGNQMASALSLQQQGAYIKQMEASANKMNVESGVEIPASVAKIKAETGLTDSKAAEVSRNIQMMDVQLKSYGTGPGATSYYQMNQENEAAQNALKTRIMQMDAETQDATMLTAIKARNDLNFAESIGAKNLYNASNTAFGRFMSFFNLGSPLLHSGEQIGGALQMVSKFAIP